MDFTTISVSPIYLLVTTYILLVKQYITVLAQNNLICNIKLCLLVISLTIWAIKKYKQTGY